MDHPEMTPVNLRESTKNALNEAFQLYKKYHGTYNDRIRISYAPRFAISCTDKLLKAVAKLAHDGNTLVHTHSSENQKEIELVKKISGLSNIEYLNSLGLTGNNVVLAHCVWPNPNEIEILKSTKTHVAHCPSSNLKLASGIAPILKFIESDINVSLGVDGAPCNNRFSMFEEMRLAGLIQKPVHGPTALPAHQILDMATINGAKALRWDSDIGSIEVGKKADFCVLDLKNPGASVPLNKELDFESIAATIVYSASPENVKMTWVDGVCLYNAPIVKTIDALKLRKKIKNAQASIIRTLRRTTTRTTNAI
jgi:cytosine/adenosine deaminase-related metal-dependent hydrolase